MSNKLTTEQIDEWEECDGCGWTFGPNDNKTPCAWGLPNHCQHDSVICDVCCHTSGIDSRHRHELLRVMSMHTNLILRAIQGHVNIDEADE